MTLESRTVFIDTQTFVSKGLNFDNHALDKFCVLCEIGKLNHLTTSIVKKEVELKIREQMRAAFSSLKSFRRHARILENSKDEAIKTLFNSVDEQETVNNAVSVFHEYLRIADTRIISAEDVNAEEVFDLYFNSTPPFSGKKKYEFPDAFSIYSLINHLGPISEKAYVISEDSDLISFCASHPLLVSVRTIDEFLDIYNTYSEKITILVKNETLKLIPSIKGSIESALTDAEAYNDESCWENSTVIGCSIVEIYEFNPLVLEVDDDTGLVAFDVDIDIEFTVAGPDYLNGIYDKESGEVFTFGESQKTVITTQTFEIEIWYGYSFNKKTGNIENFTENNFSILGLESGLYAAVEE